MKDLATKFEEVQLVYRNKTKAADRPSVNTAQKAYEILRASWNEAQINLFEEFKVLFLDNQLRLMSLASISKGGMSGTLVDPRIVFAMALKRRASTLILAHNHPSGALKPSQADISLTKNFTKLGKLHNIPIQDHIILAEDNYFSFCNDGYLELFNE